MVLAQLAEATKSIFVWKVKRLFERGLRLEFFGLVAANQCQPQAFKGPVHVPSAGSPFGLSAGAPGYPQYFDARYNAHYR